MTHRQTDKRTDSAGCSGGRANKAPVCGMLRYPLPEHYSVTMEVAKDRTTKARVETCSSEMFDNDQCPRYVTEGQRFIVRSLNEPCHKMVCSIRYSHH